MTLLWKGLTIVPRRLAEHGLRTTWLWLYEKYARLRDGFSPPETSRVSHHLFVGGQQYRRGLERMRSLGIGATLNLREEADDAASGVAFPRHLWLPTPDDGAPTLLQLQQGVEFIGGAVTAGQGVYIHCAQGVGRAPSMAAAYLIREGADAAGALARIRAVRPFITPTSAQVARLEEWTALVRSQRHDHVG